MTECDTILYCTYKKYGIIFCWCNNIMMYHTVRNSSTGTRSRTVIYRYVTCRNGGLVSELQLKSQTLLTKALQIMQFFTQRYMLACAGRWIIIIVDMNQVQKMFSLTAMYWYIAIPSIYMIDLHGLFIVITIVRNASRFWNIVLGNSLQSYVLVMVKWDNFMSFFYEFLSITHHNVVID